MKSHENTSCIFYVLFNTLRLWQNGIFKGIFLNANVLISIEISLSWSPREIYGFYSCIVSDNGLALVRRQAIIWTNGG